MLHVSCLVTIIYGQLLAVLVDGKVQHYGVLLSLLWVSVKSHYTVYRTRRTLFHIINEQFADASPRRRNDLAVSSIRPHSCPLLGVPLSNSSVIKPRWTRTVAHWRMDSASSRRTVIHKFHDLSIWIHDSRFTPIHHPGQIWTNVKRIPFVRFLGRRSSDVSHDCGKQPIECDGRIVRSRGLVNEVEASALVA